MKKNISKIIVLILVINIIYVFNLTYSYAVEKENSNNKMAEELYELGLFKGKSSSIYMPLLEDNCTSSEAITLIGRALKWDVDKNAKSSFDDVPDWAVPYTEYAKEHGVTSGVGNGKFGDLIDGRRMLSWMLSALGEDKNDVWENTEKYSKKYDILIPETSLRNDVVYIIYEGIKHPKVGEKITLLEKIKIAFDSEKVDKLPGIPGNFVLTDLDEDWTANVNIKEDMSFEGSFIKTKNDENSNALYDRTQYISYFKGAFDNLKRVGEYEYSMEIKFINEENIEEKVVDGVKIKKGFPAGLNHAKKISYFVPGKLKSMLPGKLKNWDIKNSNILKHHGFYNINKGNAFFSF